MAYKQLVRAKEILVQYLEYVEFDYDSIEYFLDSIDYLLQNRIPCTSSILSILIEDMLIAWTYHRGKELLQVVSLLKELKEELEKCTILP